MENENTVSTPAPETNTTPEISNVAGDNWTPESTEALGHDESRLYDENGEEVSLGEEKPEEEVKPEPEVKNCQKKNR